MESDVGNQLNADLRREVFDVHLRNARVNYGTPVTECTKCSALEELLPVVIEGLNDAIKEKEKCEIALKRLERHLTYVKKMLINR
jgi:hypothetical protein